MTESKKVFSPRWDHLNMDFVLDEPLYYEQCCKRVSAIKSVLQRLPDDVIADLEKLNKTRTLFWFLPTSRFYGVVVNGPDGRMIHLSQILELMSDSAIIGTVAHELAHLVKGHLDVPIAKRGMDTTEKEADETVLAWEFGEELSAFKAESELLERQLWGELKRSLEDAWRQN